MNTPQHKPQPEPPVNVRVELQDGRVIPLECVHRGLCLFCDCNHWLAVIRVDVGTISDPTAVKILAEYVPPGTVIDIEFQGKIEPDA